MCAVKKMWTYFILVVSAVCSVITAEDLCQGPCECLKYTDRDTPLPTSVVDCSGTNIMKFPNQVQIPDDTNVLDMSYNEINTLENNEYVVSNDNLRKLVLAHNRINKVNSYFFENITNIHYLDLSFNNLTELEYDVFYNLKKLTHLDLSFNLLKTLPDNMFGASKHLKYLDISYNPLGEFLMREKDLLQRDLDVSRNLTHLILANVGINYLHSSYFDSYDSLVHISLADNDFGVVPTLPGAIEYLDLSGNNLSFVSAKYLNYLSLKVLKLSRMDSFTSIHHYAFYNLPSLEKLVITDCPNLKEFTELAFGIAAKTTTEHPEYFSLARNGLQHLNETYKFLFRKMNYIDLRNNPWHCDCDILWLKEFEGFLYKSEHIRCATPSYLNNKKVLDLTEEDLQHCYPHIYGKRSHRILIVVLTTAVIVLVGVVFYLVRYPKSWARLSGEFRVGPNSPYSPTPNDHI